MRRAAACYVALCALCAAPPVRAADEAAKGAPARSLVRVYVSGTPGAVARIAVTVRELCSRLGLDVVVEEAPDESRFGKGTPRSWIEAYIDLRPSVAPRIVVVDSETRRELERRTLPASSSLELSVEEAAHVLYAAAESALSARARGGGGALPATPVTLPERPEQTEAPMRAPEAPSTRSGGTKEPPEALPAASKKTSAPATPELHPRDAFVDRVPEASTTRTSPRRFESEAKAFGGIAAFDPSHALGGFGASLDAGLRVGAIRVSGVASANAYLPSEVSRDGVTATLRAEGMRFSALVGWEATPVLVPFLSVGGGADRVTVNADSPPGGWGAGAESRVDPMLQALLGAEWRFTNVVGAFFAMGIDADLARHRYLIEANGASETFLDLARVRPMAMLGLTMSVAGTRSSSASGEPKP